MFPFGPRPGPPPRLPRPLAPLPSETIKSYLRRLGKANQLQPATLHAHLAGTRQPKPISIDNLAAAVGRPAHHLLQALPELRYTSEAETATALIAHTRRPACRRCAAQRGVLEIAIVWQPYEDNICSRHKVWVGPPARHYHQFDLTDLPQHIRAQRRHHLLARRRGRQRATDAFAEAAHITDLWARHGYYRHRREPLIEALRGAIPITGKLTNGDPVIAAVTYPETVDLAHVLAMPQWRHRVTNHPYEIRRFARDIEHHVGIEYRPFDSGWDPLGHWFHRHHSTPARAIIRRNASR